MASVELIHIRKSFGDTLVVPDLSLDVEDGELLVLVGPSGCGKSTCLRMIAGLEEPTEGMIRIGNRDVTALPPRERDIGMVFQSYALYPHLTVFENMAFALKLRKVSSAEIRERVEEVARALELTELLKRKPGALSGLSFGVLSSSYSTNPYPTWMQLSELRCEVSWRVCTAVTVRRVCMSRTTK